MKRIELGIEMLINFSHCLNKPFDNVVIFSGILMNIKELQDEKAYSPIELTCFGNNNEVNDVHKEKQLFPIEVKVFGRVIFINDEHEKNARSPIEIKEFPNEILFNDEHL